LRKEIGAKNLSHYYLSLLLLSACILLSIYIFFANSFSLIHFLQLLCYRSFLYIIIFFGSCYPSTLIICNNIFFLKISNFQTRAYLKKCHKNRIYMFKRHLKDIIRTSFRQCALPEIILLKIIFSLLRKVIDRY